MKVKNCDNEDTDIFWCNGKTYIKDAVYFPYGVKEELVLSGRILNSGVDNGTDTIYYCELSYYRKYFKGEYREYAS